MTTKLYVKSPQKGILHLYRQFRSQGDQVVHEARDSRGKYLLYQYKQFSERIALMKTLMLKKFANLTNIFDVFQYDSNWYICTEYYENDLYQRIRKFSTIQSEDFRYTAKQIACGVKELHDLDIIHRDLKLENIYEFAVTDQRGCSYLTYKICNLELSREQHIMMTQNLGTPYYQAPEQIQSQAYDKSIDIWALFYELSTGKPLFDGRTIIEIQTKIQKSTQEDIYKQIESMKNLHNKYRDIIKKMIVIVPKNRINIAQVIKYLEPSISLSQDKAFFIVGQQETTPNKTIKFSQNSKPPISHQLMTPSVVKMISSPQNNTKLNTSQKSAVQILSHEQSNANSPMKNQPLQNQEIHKNLQQVQSPSGRITLQNYQQIKIISKSPSTVQSVPEIKLNLFKIQKAKLGTQIQQISNQQRIKVPCNQEQQMKIGLIPQTGEEKDVVVQKNQDTFIQQGPSLYINDPKLVVPNYFQIKQQCIEQQNTLRQKNTSLQANQVTEQHDQQEASYRQKTPLQIKCNVSGVGQERLPNQQAVKIRIPLPISPSKALKTESSSRQNRFCKHEVLSIKRDNSTIVYQQQQLPQKNFSVQSDNCQPQNSSRQ